MRPPRTSRPPAPPVYRPAGQPVAPKAPGRQTAAQINGPARHVIAAPRMVAPPALMQRASAVVPRLAPPVYRPPQRVLSAPPVYRPSQPPAIMRAASGPNRPRLPVHRARQPAPIRRASGTVQPKMGMELELPIVIVDDQGNNVTHKIAIIDWPPYFKVEGDASTAAGSITHPKANATPTIIEIVTEAFDEHLPASESFLGDQILKIHEFLETVESLTAKQTKATTVGTLIKKLKGAKLGGQVPATAENWLVGVPTTGRQSSPPTANVHFTVGIRYQSIVDASQWVYKTSREGARSRTTHEAAHQAVVGLADSLDVSFLELTNAEQQAVIGFCYLVFSNAQAVASADVKKDALAKNYAPMLSRTSFTSVLASLPPNSKAFVKKFGKNIADVLEISLLDSAGAKEYLQESFAGQAKAQTSYFHGMRMLGTEPVGPANNRDQGVPVELRALGTKQHRSSEEWIRLAYEVLEISRQWHGTSDVTEKFLASKASASSAASKLSVPAKPPGSGVGAPQPLAASPVVAVLNPPVQLPVKPASQAKLSSSIVVGQQPTLVASPVVVKPASQSLAKPSSPVKPPASSVVKPQPPLASAVVVKPGAQSVAKASSPVKPPASSVVKPQPLAASAVVPVKPAAQQPPKPSSSAPKPAVSAVGPTFVPPNMQQIGAIKSALKPIPKSPSIYQ